MSSEGVVEGSISLSCNASDDCTNSLTPLDESVTLSHDIQIAYAPTVSLQEVSSGDEPLKVYLYDVAEESLDDSLDGAIIVRDDGNSSATEAIQILDGRIPWELGVGAEP